MAKVYDTAAQAEVEVPAAEATAGIRAGKYVPIGRTRIVRSDGELGTIDPSELGRALDSGFRLVDDDEATDITLRREAESTAGLAKGFAEAATSGATLGLSTLVASQYNDPEAMARRREALGTLGDVAEVGGAALPVIATLGSSAPAQAGVQTGRGLAATVLRNTPTALVSRGAMRFERGLASMAGEGGAVTKLLPKIGGGFVEGAAQGAGASIDDQVLGNHELAADQIAADGLMGGLFGAGAPIAVKGLASVMSGTARAPIAGMQKVLGRGNAESGGLATREVAEMVAKGSDAPLSPMAKGFKTLAKMHGVPEEPAHRLAVLADAENGPETIRRVARDMPRIEREAAELVAERVPQVHADMGEARRLANGESKARYWERQSPQSIEARRAAAMETDAVHARAKGQIEKLVSENVDPRFPRAPRFNEGVLREADDALQVFERDLVEAHQLSPRDMAVSKAMAADRYKRQLGQVIEDNGGWGDLAHVDPPTRATNRALRDMYSDVQRHLERRDLWGDAAETQAKINAAYGRYADADAAYKQATAGSGLGTIVNPDGTINTFKAIKLVRAQGRVGGDVAVERLMDALRARVAYFDEVAKHTDLDDAGKAAFSRVKSNVADLERRFKSLADDAAVADDLKSLRRAEGNDSPSHQLLTTVGPAVGGAVGSMLGPLGAAVGTLIGAATQPHRSLLAYATIHGVLGRVDKRLGSVVSKMMGKATGLSLPKVPRLPLGTIAGAMAVRSGEENNKRRETAVAKATQLLGSSEALADALTVPLYDVGRESPAVATMVQGNVQRAARFLQSKAPKVYSRGKTKLVDPVSAASFERYLEAVTDPIGALERFDANRITRETIEAIQVVYPALYADLQRRIVDELAEAHAEGREIPYDRRVRLGATFNVQTDPSLVPTTGVTIQDSIGAQFDEPDAAATMAAGRKAPGKIEGGSESMQTAGDRTESWRAQA